MFDYLQQFNRLSKDLRDKVSSPSAMAVLSELEDKYRVDLAAIVMKVMVKTIPIKELPLRLSAEAGLSPDKAEELSRELKEKLFVSLGDYLGFASEKRALDLDRDIEIIIKEAGLVLPSAALAGRLKTILSTFLRGVRSRIDVRNTLAKDIKIGGLNLSAEEIERTLKVCGAHDFKNLAVTLPGQPSEALISPAPLSAPAPVSSVQAAENPKSTVVPPRLAEIIAQADQVGGYDLKKSLEQKKAESAVSPVKDNQQVPVIDTGHEIAAPKPRLDLPAPDKTLAQAPVSSKPVVSPANLPISPDPILPPAVLKKGAVIAPTAVSAIPVKPTLPPLKPAAPDRPSSPIKPPVKRNEQVAVSEKPPLKPGPAANRPAPAASFRPQMHDIKPMPKVMGPIEELQFLDVVNFRRLGMTPAEAVNKIYAKIKLLEKDGYDKMVTGVKAWRQSPTNRLYLRLGQEAAAKGLLLEGLLADRQKSGQDYLSFEEIRAIMALNSKLVF